MFGPTERFCVRPGNYFRFQQLIYYVSDDTCTKIILNMETQPPSHKCALQTMTDKTPFEITTLPNFG